MERRRWLAAALLACAGTVHAQTLLTVAFNNKPPFFYFEAGEARGILVEQARQIFLKAGVPIQFEELPFLRAMAMLESQRPNYALLGFSKTPERERFALFSNPIYRDRTPVILVRSADAEQFRTYPTLEKMAAASEFSFGGKEGNIYPIDSVLKGMGPRDRRFSVEAIKLPQLLLAKRFDFMMLFPEEIPSALTLSRVDTSAIQQIAYPDMPKGGLRYILFSQSVPRDLIQRVNTAIDLVIPAP